MKVLGFRSDQNAPRYAVVESSTDRIVLINRNKENRLKFPNAVTTEVSKVGWLYQELLRIFNEHQDIDLVVIKSNEFTSGDTKAKRLAAYQDATMLLLCKQIQKPVHIKLYASLATTRATVKEHAESRIGKTDNHWDHKIADAVVAAWWGIYDASRK